MECVMKNIGEKIHKKYHWVDIEVLIYLYMDNAGGHGSNEIVKECVDLLKEKYNAIIINQIPRSPETKMLDIGAWIAIQSIVKKIISAVLETVTALQDQQNLLGIH
eukprot:5861528-Ditylum_brightwellii.AAC.1